jgi:lipid-binding SYLF domain-containing protein
MAGQRRAEAKPSRPGSFSDLAAGYAAVANRPTLREGRLAVKIRFAALQKPRVIIVALMCTFALLAHADDAADKAKKAAKEQKEIRENTQKILQRLYKAQPAAQAAVANGAGYGVFSNTGVKILFAGSGKGEGVAVDNKTKKETFMKMVELQAGLGFGVKKFSIIFVFGNDKVLDSFINSGWEFGGQATAAEGGSMAGATSVSDGVWMYQMTDKGLAAEITIKGTKYYKDGDLNSSADTSKSGS